MSKSEFTAYVILGLYQYRYNFTEVNLRNAVHSSKYHMFAMFEHLKEMNNRRTTRLHPLRFYKVSKLIRQYLQNHTGISQLQAIENKEVLFYCGNNA